MQLEKQNLIVQLSVFKYCKMALERKWLVRIQRSKTETIVYAIIENNREMDRASHVFNKGGDVVSEVNKFKY